MNKQELINYCNVLKENKNRFINCIDVDRIIDRIKQLDEPETGHTDEGPRYLKNILARLRELPLYNREVWLKVIMGEFKQDFSRAKWRDGYEQGKVEGMVEREKVKVPQFVADWIEVAKPVYSLSGGMTYGGPGVNKWLENEDNQRTFALAWFDGYEVEEEKRYKIEVKGVSENSVLIHDKTEECWFFEDDNNEDTIYVYHTRKELKEANFGWVFDCPGVEVEEVE